MYRTIKYKNIVSEPIVQIILDRDFRENDQNNTELMDKTKEQRKQFGIPGNLEDLMDDCHLKYVIDDIENIDQKIKSARNYNIDNDWIRFSMRRNTSNNTNKHEFSILYNPSYNKADFKIETDKPEIIKTIKQYLSLRERLESKRHCLEQIISDEQVQNIGPNLIQIKSQNFRYEFPTPVFAISFDHVH